MDLLQVKGFHRVNAESRMPSVTEDGKYPRWNNALGYFEYITIKESEDETYVDTITQVGNTITITRNDGVFWTLDLGLASIDLGLPGDKKILFDENDSIGGRDNFKYDYDTTHIILTDIAGIYAQSTGIDSTPVNILQYLGNNNLFLDYTISKTPSANMADNIAIGELALATITAGNRNIAIGKQAGAASTNTISGSVYIGPYAGRMNTTDNRLFIHNTDYTTLAEFQDNSLLYGEFDNGRLFINNRLSVREEVQIGTFDVANTPGAGMVQFVDAGGGLVKPQYYDATQWVDFANGTDSYLTNVTYDGTNITFEVNGQSNIVLPFEDLHLTVAGSIYNVQLNDGSGDLMASANFSFNTVSNVLSINGILQLLPVDATAFPVNEGNILFDGEHYYGYINGEYVQLDNDGVQSGKYTTGESVGSAVEIFAGIDSKRKVLKFYDIKAGAGITIDDADEFGNVLISLNFDVSGTNLGIIGQGLYDSTTVTDESAILNFKRLYSSDTSVVITDMGNYLDLSASGAAGGETNDGQNVGAGEGRIYDELNGKNGSLIPFRTIKAGTNITISTDTVNKIINIDSDALLTIGANLTGGDQGIYQGYTDDGSGNRTLNFYPLEGIDDITVSLNGNVIQIGLDGTLAIPAIDGIIAPVATNTNKTLTWSLNYDADIRDGVSYTLENIVQLNLGSNLTYNPATNTLDSIAGQTGGFLTLIAANITRNGDGTVNRLSSTRTVTFTEGTNSYQWAYAATTGLGWLAFENDYPVASDTQQGILQVDVTGPLSITNGILSFSGSFSPADPDQSIQFNNGGAFGGSAGMLYKVAEDRIYLSAQTAATSGIIFGTGSTSNAIYNHNTGITGSHLYLKADNNTDVDSLQILAAKVSIGVEDKDSDDYFVVQDPSFQAKAYTVVIKSWMGNEALKIRNDGAIYLPQLSLSATDFVVGFDSSTKQLYYTAASNVAGIVTINTDAESGLMVNNGNTSSASTVELDQNDSKLVTATIAVGDYIGFWDISANKQSKTTLSNFLNDIGGWNLYINDVSQEPIKIGDNLNIKGINAIDVSYDANTNTITLDVTEGGITIHSDMSVTGIGTVDTPVKLVNDESAPGNTKYYGTDAVGSKGYHSLPASTINTQDSVTGDGNTSPVKLVNDVDQPGQKYYYGTDSNGNKAWIPFCQAVADCVTDDPTIVIPPIDPNTGDVNVQISRSGCDDTFELIASNFVSTVINLTNIRIDTVPAYGTLKYNGATVTAGQILNIVVGNLQYQLLYVADSNTGAAYVDTFTFSTKYSTNSSYSSSSATVNVSVDACLSFTVCFGYLYNWYAVNDSRGLVNTTDGWDVPTRAQWDALITYIGGSTIAGGKLKDASNLFWNNIVVGTNDYNFSARGAGIRSQTAWAFVDIKGINYFHCKDEYSATGVQILRLTDSSNSTFFSTGGSKAQGVGVRLIRNATSEELLLNDGDYGFDYTGNDGKVYKTIKINTWVFTAESLEETKYANGDSIIHEGANVGYFTDAEWGAATYGAWCIYDNDVNYSCHYVVPPNEIRAYGMLYTRLTAYDSRLITSDDSWVIPSDTIWDSLITHLGGSTVAGGVLKAIGEIFWTNNIDASDQFGFKAVGAGYRNSDVDATFTGFKTFAKYLSTTTFIYQLYNNSDSLSKLVDSSTNVGYSITLVKDATGIIDGTFLQNAYIGNDGKIYNAVAINGYYWLVNNLEETKFRNGDTILYMYESFPWYHAEDDNKDHTFLTIYNGDPNNLLYEAPTPYTGDYYQFEYIFGLNDIVYVPDPDDMYCMVFNTDGTKYYASVRESSVYYIYEYTLSTPYNPSTGTVTDSLQLTHECKNFVIKPDGSKIYMCGASNLYEYSLSVSWNLSSTVTNTGIITRINVVNGFGADYSFLGWSGVTFNDDGSKLFGIQTVSGIDRIIELTPTTAWAITSVTYDNYYNLPSNFNLGTAYGITMINTRKFAMTYGNQVSTPDYRLSIIELDGDYDFSNMTMTSFCAAGISGYGYGIAFNEDGSKCYFPMYNGNNTIQEVIMKV